VSAARDAEAFAATIGALVVGGALVTVVARCAVGEALARSRGASRHQLAHALAADAGVVEGAVVAIVAGGIVLGLAHGALATFAASHGAYPIDLAFIVAGAFGLWGQARVLGHVAEAREGAVLIFDALHADAGVCKAVQPVGALSVRDAALFGQRVGCKVAGEGEGQHHCKRSGE